MTQRERIENTDHIKAFLDPEGTGLWSGGQMQAFREGWAKAIMNRGKTAHWFKRDGISSSATSICGVDSAVRWLYGPGNFPKCQHCMRAIARRKQKGIA